MTMEDSDEEITGFAKALESQSVKIYVGDEISEPFPFLVPRKILFSQGPYFAAALSPKYMEGQHGVLRFPEDNREAWKVLLYYFFYQRVPWPQVHDDPSPGNETLVTLTQAYLLADKYGLPVLQNAIIRATMDGFRSRMFHPGSWECILVALPATSPLRVLIIEKLVEIVERLGDFEWCDVAELCQIRGVFKDLIACHKLYVEDPDDFPWHDWRYVNLLDVDADEDRDRYLVKEAEKE